MRRRRSTSTILGAAPFGHTKLCGEAPGGQAERLRVPRAQFGPIKVPEGPPPDDRFVGPSDVLPTAWQAVECADVSAGSSLVVLGLGPIGDMAARIAKRRGIDEVNAVDLVEERLDRARRRCVDVIGLQATDDLVAEILDRTDGRGADAVIDAVRIEAHGSGAMKVAQAAAGALPNAVAAWMMKRVGADRLAALTTAIEVVRRGGTVSLTAFGKQIQFRMEPANVHRWVADIMPLLVGDGDPLGVDDFATHLPLDEAPCREESC